MIDRVHMRDSWQDNPIVWSDVLQSALDKVTFSDIPITEEAWFRDEPSFALLCLLYRWGDVPYILDIDMKKLCLNYAESECAFNRVCSNYSI